MIVVNYSKELREAFEAGRAAGALPFLRAKWPDGLPFFAGTPETYEAWIESIRDRPVVVRG